MMRRLPILRASEGLAQRVVDFVRAGVEQIFALEPDARSAQSLTEVFGEVQRCWAAGVVVEQVGEFGLKGRVVARRQIGSLQFFDGRHQDFGDIAAAVRSEVPAGVGFGSHSP